jgi:Alpha-kinase family
MHAARTNLTSDNVNIHSEVLLGEGSFRKCFAGTYVGGNRNGQEAACKRFKSEYRYEEDEFFSQDFKIIEQTIMIATDWNEFCDQGKEILVNKGSIHICSVSGIKYLVEPLIRNYEKFTSNSGGIGDTDLWDVRCMEAFTHYSYHRTGGSMIVCDLQGRHKFDKYANSKSRFELSDPAICSRARHYGPTDLGEKGIDSFFASHKCNEFCQAHWARPSGRPRHWFPQTLGTAMFSTQYSSQLSLTSGADFRKNLDQLVAGLGMISEDYDDSDVNSYDEDDW